MTDTFDIRMNNLAYGGDAIGRLPDGRVVFVPFAIPGELVRVKIVEDKARHARGGLVEVLEASPERVVPRCQHFGTCGGCQYQHMNYPTQLNAKAAILREQIERIGGLKAFPPVEILAASEPWNYRNSMQFHLTPEGKLGFQRANSNQTLAIRECHLPMESINRLWPQLEVEPMPGLERINMRLGVDDELMIILESSDSLLVDFSIEDLAVSVVQLSPAGSTVLAGSDHIEMEVSGKRFRVSAGTFFQVNTRQAQAMVSYLTDHLLVNEKMTVLDAYCGVGLFSAFLAPKVKRLVGIEVSAQACEDFAINLEEFEHVELYEDAVENVLSQVQFDPDVIIMDPPRAGLGAKTVEGVLTQGAANLAYISCDPATLARDGKQLTAGGYLLKSVALVDMFPQTYHIESISLWEKTCV
jgi:23S rRNA (uracil1939-C5)-methyltransferase